MFMLGELKYSDRGEVVSGDGKICGPFLWGILRSKYWEP